MNATIELDIVILNKYIVLCDSSLPKLKHIAQLFYNVPCFIHQMFLTISPLSR